MSDVEGRHVTGGQVRRLAMLLVVVQLVLVVACVLPWGPVLWSGATTHGGFLVALAAVIGGTALIALGRDTRISPIPAEHGRLRRGGIYAFIRHPMYLAVMLAAIGITLMSGRLLAVLATIGLAVVLVVKAHVEDLILQRKFGWEFAVYAGRVPAVVPQPWRSHRR